MVKNGTLITTWDNVLWGIMQALVLGLAEKAGIKTKKRKITSAELLQADEVFITGSSKLIVPVVQIDEKKIAQGIPGTMTRQLITALKDFREHY